MSSQKLHLYREVAKVLSPLKALVDQLVQFYPKLLHQLLGEEEESRYIPLVQFIDTDINNVIQEISKISIEIANKLNEGEENRTVAEEIGEIRIKNHLQSVFDRLHDCATSMQVIKKTVPGVLVEGSDGEQKPFDIHRNAWRRMMDSSKGGNENAQVHVARVVNSLQDFWSSIGWMMSGLGVVEDELRRDPVH